MLQISFADQTGTRNYLQSVVIECHQDGAIDWGIYLCIHQSLVVGTILKNVVPAGPASFLRVELRQCLVAKSACVLRVDVFM